MGLAAPQINQAIRLFVIDTEQVYDKSDDESRESTSNFTLNKFDPTETNSIIPPDNCATQYWSNVYVVEFPRSMVIA
ncbi:MAG: hypothetical protein EBU84_19030 [Actinobacteria bacterium]|nr:hypothetical protein [Actinomycetota bacterium]